MGVVIGLPDLAGCGNLRPRERNIIYRSSLANHQSIILPPSRCHSLSSDSHSLVATRVSGLSPMELSARFSGASGHSQSLVTAVAIFSSEDDVSFLKNVQKALYAGLRGQQLLSVLGLEPSVIRRARETPSSTRCAV